MEEEQEDLIEQSQSKYNSAMAQLYRLNDLWNKSHEFAIKGNYDAYKFTLDRAWVELAPDCSDKQVQTKKEYLLLLNKISKTLRNIQLGKKPDKRLSPSMEKDERITRGRYYSALQRYEIFLRKILNSQGKGSAYRDVSSEEIE